jgi:hypothetical protein
MGLKTSAINDLYKREGIVMAKVDKDRTLAFVAGHGCRSKRERRNVDF